MKVNTTSIKLNKFTPMISLLLLCKNINLFLAFLLKKLHIITYKNNRTFFNMPKKISLFICLLSLLITGISSYKASCHFLNDTYFLDTPLSDTTNCVIKKISASESGIKSFSKTPSGLYSTACCVIEKDSKQILYEKNSSKKLPMASTTKIMTCILALEKGSPKDIVTVSKYAASMPDVQLNMQTGEQFRLADLLYSLMLESHNDTAVAIAEHIGGSVKGFAKLMNQKAAELGCNKTHFVTPNGLDSDKHYTTAYELCLIADYALKNSGFRKIITTPSYSFSNISGSKQYSVNNKDAFLTQYNGAIGVKTGFTGKAGYCFCGAAKRKNTTLISAVLACGWPPNKTYKWKDTKKLMDYGFNNFTKVNFKPENKNVKIFVKGGQSPYTYVKLKDNSCKLMLSSSDTVTYKIKLPRTLDAPVSKNSIIGYVKLFINNKLYRQTPLRTENSGKAVDINYIRYILIHTLCGIS